MRTTPAPRCPYCGLRLFGQGDRPLLPGMLVVCAGCAGPARFDDGGDRLVVLGPGELTEGVAADVLAMQARVRERFDGLGLPPGHRWQSAALCEPCATAFEPERQWRAARGLPRSRCGFCGELTDSAIFRRLLLPS